MGKMVVALEGFVSSVAGKEVIIAQGDILDADHELVKRTPAEWWTPVAARFAVESASAAPGEQRDVKVRVKKAAEVA